MKQTTRSAYFQTIQRTTLELQRKMDDPPSLDELADEACLSPFYFHRLFRGMVGEAPGELVRRLRMERAALDLLESQDSVSDIAFKAGFISHEGFTRAFRDSFAQLPRSGEAARWTT